MPEEEIPHTRVDNSSTCTVLWVFSHHDIVRRDLPTNFRVGDNPRMFEMFERCPTLRQRPDVPVAEELSDEQGRGHWVTSTPGRLH